jgi:hypothetical protein
MSTTLVTELKRHVTDPPAPDFYTVQGAAAWRRGVLARAWIPRRPNPYTRRYMRRAWQAGYDAMATAIREATR